MRSWVTRRLAPAMLAGLWALAGGVRADEFHVTLPPEQRSAHVFPQGGTIGNLVIESDSKVTSPFTAQAVKAGLPSTDAEALESDGLRELIQLRQETIKQVLDARREGLGDDEFKAAERLYDIERRILLREDEFSETQRADIETLRDHFLGLLTWLADRYETTDPARCEVFWKEAVEQLAACHGSDHWTTRTAVAEWRRLQTTRNLNEHNGQT